MLNVNKWISEQKWNSECILFQSLTNLDRSEKERTQCVWLKFYSASTSMSETLFDADRWQRCCIQQAKSQKCPNSSACHKPPTEALWLHQLHLSQEFGRQLSTCRPCTLRTMLLLGQHSVLKWPHLTTVLVQWDLTSYMYIHMQFYNNSKQESLAIAKTTARYAQYMGAWKVSRVLANAPG